jgi:three-Cys-motif partner protein
MPSFKPKGLWEAAPHTRAKIEIVSRYLYLWFEILGRTKKINRLVYIDGFAGPGEYTNLPIGSPVAVLNQAKRALFNADSPLRSKELRFHFIEKQKWVVEQLHGKLSAIKLQSQIRWRVHRGAFEEKIGAIVTDVREGHQDSVAIFCFIDPFGATGVPFRAVGEILASDTCEVLLNLDSDGIGRLMEADEIQKNTEHLNQIFGDTDWRSEIGYGLSIQQLCARVLAAYKRRLLALKNVRYVFAFAMNDKPGKLNYHLVFAGQHPKGLEKMKEAMKRIDQTGDYSFADDSVGQGLLGFNFNDPGTFAQKMHQHFLGKTVAYDDVSDYVLNETPFTNPSKILEWLMEPGQIEVEWVGEPSKSGFPKENVKAIRFETREPPKKETNLTFPF